MSIADIVGRCVFDWAAQERFARLSGDRNPIHMDVIAARRTMAGSPVVHGIHTLCVGLDMLHQRQPDLPPITSLRVTFNKMVHLGDKVEFIVSKRDQRSLRLSAMIDGANAMTANLGFIPAARSPQWPVSSEVDFTLQEPLEMTLNAAAKMAGRIRLHSEPSEFSRVLPAASRALGAERVRALAGFSYLVGMICPGLHSIFKDLNLTSVPADQPAGNHVNFSVADTDSRFKQIEMAVAGGGWVGSVGAFMRPAPMAQPGVSQLQALVKPGEFDGINALIIGGSRGLGELIAKIIACGGGHVTISYAQGEEDARRVQSDLSSISAKSEILQYDIAVPAAEQLMKLVAEPNQIYYMATPFISPRRIADFEAERLEKFLKYYVVGFFSIYEHFTKQGLKCLKYFYPSSVFVNDRPTGMTEYAMAKSAGEILCADINAKSKTKRVLVERLPRLPSDQTASLFEVDTAEPIETMLSAVRGMRQCGCGE